MPVGLELDGGRDGDVLGLEEGTTLGLIDGTVVGLLLGTVLGALVGEVVGCVVISSHVWFLLSQSGTHMNPETHPQCQWCPSPA